MDDRAFHAVVRGRVQGVGFRMHTQREAQRLRLRGYVRNLPDGSVEVEAGGPSDAIDALLEWLRRGPPSARVESLHWDWAPAGTLELPFSVR